MSVRKKCQPNCSSHSVGYRQHIQYIYIYTNVLLYCIDYNVIYRWNIRISQILCDGANLQVIIIFIFMFTGPPFQWSTLAACKSRCKVVVEISYFYILDCCFNERLVKTFYFITFSTAHLHFDYSHILPSSVLPR